MQHLADDSLWGTEPLAINMCQNCTGALGNLHRFYAEFSKLTTEASALGQLLDKTLAWINQVLELGPSLRNSSFGLKASSLCHGHVKAEPAENLEILPDLPDFGDVDDEYPPNAKVEIGNHDSDDDWVWPGTSRKRKTGEGNSYK